MQHDKKVKLKQVKIIRDKETDRIIDLKQAPSSTYTARNNAEAYLLKQTVATRIAKLRK